jgi:hypothetical protein
MENIIFFGSLALIATAYVYKKIDKQNVNQNQEL